MNPHFGALRAVGYPISPFEHNKFKNTERAEASPAAHDFREPVLGKCLYVLSGFHPEKHAKSNLVFVALEGLEYLHPQRLKLILRELHDLNQQR